MFLACDRAREGNGNLGRDKVTKILGSPHHTPRTKHPEISPHSLAKVLRRNPLLTSGILTQSYTPDTATFAL